MNGLKILLTSKRFWIALITAVVSLLVLFGLPIDEAKAKDLVEILTVLAGAVIAAITGTDIVNGLGTPDGYDHKGRKIIDVEAKEKP